MLTVDNIHSPRSAMPYRTTDGTPRRLARVTGAFYLLTIVAGVFAEAFVRGRLVVRTDAVATATNILANETLYRVGLVADLAMLASYVVVTALFYEMFRPVRRSVSLSAAGFSVVGIAVLAVNCLNHLVPLVLLDSVTYQPAIQVSQLQALSLVALRLHARGYGIATVFFGIYCVLIGWLAFRSGWVPRALGALMAVGGVAYLASSIVGLLSPAVASRLPDLGVIGGVAELALSAWLIVRATHGTGREDNA